MHNKKAMGDFIVARAMAESTRAFSTASAGVPSNFDINKFNDLVREITKLRKEIPKMFVITWKAPLEGAIQIEYNGDKYILITKPQWLIFIDYLKRSNFYTESVDTISSLSGIPVVESEELATEIWKNVVERIRKEQSWPFPYDFFKGATS